MNIEWQIQTSCSCIFFYRYYFYSINAIMICNFQKGSVNIFAVDLYKKRHEKVMSCINLFF